MVDKNNDQKKKIDPKVEEEKKKQEALLKEFLEKNTKKIKVSDFSEDINRSIRNIKKEFELLIKEIEETKDSFLEKSNFLNKKVDFFIKSGNLKYDKNSHERIKSETEKYENYLNSMLKEVEREAAFYLNLCSDKAPEFVDVVCLNQDPFSTLNIKFKLAKKYIKKVQNALRVTFSRFNVSLQDHIRTLNYLDIHLKNRKKQ